MEPELDQIALEQFYFLPPVSSDLAKDWDSKSQTQISYADLCQRGATLIANQIIEARKSGKPLTLRELYQTAARVRRAIAWQNPSSRENYLFYGQPVAGVETDCVSDKIYPSSPRYGEHFFKVDRSFNNLKTYATSTDELGENMKNEAFGGYYSFHLDTTKPLCRTLTITHSEKIRIAEIEYLGFIPQYTLSHVQAKDQAKFFAITDKHFQKLLTDGPESPEFWQEMGNISLNLFHLAPLRLGSQTGTLMVMAGITKAMGYDVIPRTPDMDHFLEAEFTPYNKYIASYGKNFIRPPKFSGIPQETSVVDTTFIDSAYDKMRKHFSDIENPCERLTKYINDCWDIPAYEKIYITALNVTDSHFTLTVHPPTLQKHVEDAMEFTGHKDVIDMIGLPQGKFAANPRVRIAPRDDGSLHR